MVARATAAALSHFLFAANEKGGGAAACATEVIPKSFEERGGAQERRYFGRSNASDVRDATSLAERNTSWMFEVFTQPKWARS